MLQEVSGTLYFRDANVPPAVKAESPGRKMMVVIGVVALPSNFPVDAEHQYVVTGGSMGVLDLHLETHLDTGIDHTERFKGSTVNQILCSQIWRV